MTSKSNKQTHGTVDNDITTIVLPGWGNFSQRYLFNKLKTKNKLYFEYSYCRIPGNNKAKVFANFQTMAGRFKRFLDGDDSHNESKLSDKLINIVGYSQGGMIALYAAGRYNLRISKYVSIASPHLYALKRINLGYASKNKINYQFNKKSGFLDENREYALQAHRAFKNNPNAKWLQIYSEEDIIATTSTKTEEYITKRKEAIDKIYKEPRAKKKKDALDYMNRKSSTRFVGNGETPDPKKPMEGHKVEKGALGHLLLPVNTRVIKKINDFLSK